MSRSVPFDDPLLHPPTPPLEAAPAAAESTEPPPPPPPPAESFDDGPIPFQSATAKPSSAVEVPPTTGNKATASATDAIDQSPNFIDPLNAALDGQGEDSGTSSQAAETAPASGSTRSSSSLSINVPATHNSMPTEFPTHLASPPLPQRPLSIGGTTFTAFQAFSTALQPPTTSGTPVSASGSGVDTPLPGETSNLSLEDSISDIGRSVSQPSVGLGLESGPDTQKHLPATPGQHALAWNARLSMGVSTTNPSGISFHDHPDLVDALNELMIKHVPAEQRVLRDWNALTEAEQLQEPRSKVLYTLTVENSWRAMARYTRSQILLTPLDRILELINLWYARLLALVKLGQYEMAQAELDQLGDLRGPQYRYENYPQDVFVNSDIQTQEQERGVAIRRGCMVPFELFVLKARLQGYLGDIPEAIDQLYDLIMHCKKFEAICRVSDDTVGVRQWQDITGQLHLMVLNYLVEIKDYPAATRHARDLAKKYSQDINFRSGLGRLYLQLGDVDRADKEFKELEDFVKSHLEHHSPTEQAHFKLQLTMNEALLAVTQGRWLAAKSAFEEVLVQEPENLAATNNLAVCELYAGQLNDAIPRIEKLMFAYPTSAGTSEALVFNMATLFELRTEGSMRRKQQMMVEVAKWAGDQFNVSTFKI
ncbi:Trafficking protein particle complex subunit 12 [Mortierella antarctica]|nr:Trafficking protein particle complex subunit 12 [Mortierella antarctica]